MTTLTTEKRTRVGRRLRSRRLGALAIGVSGAAMVLTVGIGAAADDPGNGRDPGAVPGEVTDAASPTGPVTDGRAAADVADQGQARTATSSGSSAAVVLDNGRGGPDPAAGPNRVTADAARSAAVSESGVDTDSGAVPEPDASRAPAPPPEPVGADQDVPGSSTASQAGDADRGGSSSPEAPVDLDS